MRIHYNNGENEKIIDDVIAVMMVDRNSPVTVALRNGKELTISIDNIEMILDDSIFANGGIIR